MTLILAVVYQQPRVSSKTERRVQTSSTSLFINAALGAVYSCPGFVNGLGGRSPELSLLSLF